jgi:hypothetical protein
MDDGVRDKLGPGLASSPGALGAVPGEERLDVTTFQLLERPDIWETVGQEPRQGD